MTDHGAMPDSRQGAAQEVLRLAVLGVLAIVSLLSVWLEALYLPSYWGAIPLPFTALAAAGINVAIIFGAATATRHPLGLAMPLVLWVLGFLYLATPGPGGDLMFLASWETLLLFVLGLFPPLGVLVWKIMAIAVKPLTASSAHH